MTTHRPDFELNRPGALIAALPAVLGFVPEKSLVLVSVDRGDLGAVMRVDLSDELAGRVEQLAQVAAASGPDAAIAVIVDAEGAQCPMCNEDYRQLCAELTDALSQHDVVLWAAHVVDRVAVGGRWHCVDGCGSRGVIDDSVGVAVGGRGGAGRPAALPAPRRPAGGHRGRRPGAQRRAGRGGRTTAVARAVEHRADPGGRCRRDVEKAMAAAARVAGGQSLSDAELAELGCALTDVQVRDTLYALAVGENAGEAETLWAILARTLPPPWRVEALVLLAFSAYARGDGPLAGVSLEAALRCDPGHRMAEMLDTALQSGLRPEQIRELAITGYRLAEQLGVRLPPRRAFGRRAG